MEISKDTIYAKKIAVIGLGYVGMPLAVRFAEKYSQVVGFDVNDEKVQLYRQGSDPTDEVGDEAIQKTSVQFTSNEQDIRDADIYIIAVPTPINQDETPDLLPLVESSKTVARNLCRGSLVLYESTVYPGVTEEICVPLLAEYSGLTYMADFKVGYSPERINPGDKEHRLDNICKIVSACDADSLETAKQLYASIIDAGVYCASSIRVAEAAKLAENAQRDVNIAFMNELAIAFDKMQVDTMEVVEAMNTKWNALKFYPGLVGGHCIGVDPYYFIYEANKLGYRSQIVANARIVNNSVANFVVESTAKLMAKEGICFPEANVFVLGLTFKENCPDMRNTKVLDIVKSLKQYGIKPKLCDPVLHDSDMDEETLADIVPFHEVRNADCIILAVAHDLFLELHADALQKLYRENSTKKKILIDIKSVYAKKELENSGFLVWRL